MLINFVINHLCHWHFCLCHVAKEDSPNEDHSQHHENDVEELLNEAVLVEGPVEPEVNILNIGGVENTGIKTLHHVKQVIQFKY